VDHDSEYEKRDSVMTNILRKRKTRSQKRTDKGFRKVGRLAKYERYYEKQKIAREKDNSIVSGNNDLACLGDFRSRSLRLELFRWAVKGALNHQRCRIVRVAAHFMEERVPSQGREERKTNTYTCSRSLRGPKIKRFRANRT
jgi:hypothetical protein